MLVICTSFLVKMHIIFSEGVDPMSGLCLESNFCTGIKYTGCVCGIILCCMINLF